jgi:hypothetical protein
MEEKKLHSSDSASSQDLAVTPDAHQHQDQHQAVVPSTYGAHIIKPQGRKPHDPDVSFEEYHYYAARTRKEESTLERPKTDWREIVLRKKRTNVIEGASEDAAGRSDLTEKDFSSVANRLEISDEEWTNASRAFRTAGWGACKFPEMQPM